MNPPSSVPISDRRKKRGSALFGGGHSIQLDFLLEGYRRSSPGPKLHVGLWAVVRAGQSPILGPEIGHLG